MNNKKPNRSFKQRSLKPPNIYTRSLNHTLETSTRKNPRFYLNYKAVLFFSVKNTEGVIVEMLKFLFKTAKGLVTQQSAAMFDLCRTKGGHC